MTITRDEYYLFTMPGEDLAWAETYLNDGTHVVAPTPFADITDAFNYLQDRYPGATVDTLCDASDLAEVREWARTIPLEQIPCGQDCQRVHPGTEDCW